MAPSIGASFAESETNTSGGSPIYNPQHLSGRGNRQTSRNSTSWSPTATSEATAKTDMGGGLLGGGGGSGGGGGLGGILGSVSSALSGLFGGGKGQAVSLDAYGQPVITPAAAGNQTGLLLLLGGAVLAVLLILFLALRD